MFVQPLTGLLQSCLCLSRYSLINITDQTNCDSRSQLVTDLSFFLFHSLWLAAFAVCTLQLSPPRRSLNARQCVATVSFPLFSVVITVFSGPDIYVWTLIKNSNVQTAQKNIMMKET
mmetsp:Transcript_4477/g.9598  ORF Transcript_4477/g.9598 Transcript_4477/m.9598 type:complete len:117 (+) Transcript_4477:2402-2752(+)